MVSKKIENSHIAGQIDEWRTKTYNGKSFLVYWVSASNDELLKEVRIWDKNIPLPLKIKVGDAEKEIIKKLGEPFKRDGDNIIYYTEGSETQNSVTLKFSHGKLNDVVWDYYVD